MTSGDWDADQQRLITRWYRLRREGKLYPLLHADSGCVYTYTDAADPWGTSEPLDWNKLKRDVDEVDVIVTKKEPKSDRAYSSTGVLLQYLRHQG